MEVHSKRWKNILNFMNRSPPGARLVAKMLRGEADDAFQRIFNRPADNAAKAWVFECEEDKLFEKLSKAEQLSVTIRIDAPIPGKLANCRVLFNKNSNADLHVLLPSVQIYTAMVGETWIRSSKALKVIIDNETLDGVPCQIITGKLANVGITSNVAPQQVISLV